MCLEDASNSTQRIGELYMSITVGDLEHYIPDTPVLVIDIDGEEIARYDGKDSLEEVVDRKVFGIWAGFDYDAHIPILVISVL